MRVFQGAPDQSGFYWAVICGRWEPVEVSRLDEYGMVRIGVISIMMPELYVPNDLKHRWFAGPIEPPKELEAALRFK